MIDCLFINPGNAKGLYQELANRFSTIEPPTWALLLAKSCQTRGHQVGILDTNAEHLTDEESLERIRALNPRVLVFVVYGQNVNAGTTSMSGAVRLSKFLKAAGVAIPIAFVGSYLQALPMKAIRDESSIDFAFVNEGVYALWNLLAAPAIDVHDLGWLKGIVWRRHGEAVMNPPEKLVPQERMDKDLPGYAWDLLPKKEKPFDLYRSPHWHAGYIEAHRTPYATLQTQIGCMFKCNFCMINSINRDDDAEIGVAANYSGMRYWSPETVIGWFDELVRLGVDTIRVVDEMFLLNRKYYVPLCEMLRDRGYGKHLRLWSYSRVDTVSNPEILKLVRDAGFRWLCLGIEAANRNVRLEVSKGKFQDVDIRKVVQQIHDAGIEVLANYIVGLPGETRETMQETLDLSLELCTSGWNCYAAMALPGSGLYKSAVEKGIELPSTYEAFGFHSYDCLPMRNENLTAAQLLKFRDDAFHTYHTNPAVLARVERIFGAEAAANMRDMTKIRLKRRLVEEAEAVGAL